LTTTTHGHAQRGPESISAPYAAERKHLRGFLRPGKKVQRGIDDCGVFGGKVEKPRRKEVSAEVAKQGEDQVTRGGGWVQSKRGAWIAGNRLKGSTRMG